jgi:3-hydroxybutyryl-CoA dehydrogenase
MGSGIAQILTAGHRVTVYDADQELAAAVAARAPGVRRAESLEDAVLGAEFVFEAIIEDEHAKRELFCRIGAVAPGAILASNTSSILPSALVDAVASPELFVIAHFFNPATIVPLVEIVPAPTTAPETAERVRALLAACGKEAVILGRETPGFVANRLQAALLREAFALEAAGVASFADIDRIVRASLGARWAAGGPFAIVDLGGLDIWTAVTTRLFPDLAADTVAPAALSERVATGRLGAKSGEGLYGHDPASDAELRERIAEHFAIEFPTDSA